MSSKFNFSYILWSILLFMVVGLLSSCQSIFNRYEGKTVNETDRIPLIQGGPHQGNWTTKDVGFQYNYTRKSNALYISGDLSLYAASYWTYELVDSFFFRINFIDSDGKLIESKILWGSVSSDFSYQWHVKERTLHLPSNTAALGFSYNGVVYQTDGRIQNEDGGGTALDLWYSPLGK